MSWKTSPLPRSTVVRLFGKTFTAARMNSRQRCEKSQQQLQTLLSQNWRTFSAIFIAFFESTQNFTHFEKKGQLPRLNISEVIDPDKCGYFNARKLLF